LEAQWAQGAYQAWLETCYVPKASFASKKEAWQGPRVQPCHAKSRQQTPSS
jgi:hypothetical protein